MQASMLEPTNDRPPIGQPATHADPDAFRGFALGLLRDAQGAIDADPGLAKSRLVALGEAIISGRILTLFTRPAPVAKGGLAPWQMRRVDLHIDANLERCITVAELAALVGLSCSHFSRNFKMSFGDTPHAVVMRRRIGRAKAAMLADDEPLGQIAVACGFADQAHMCRCFRAHTGTTPFAWRRENQYLPEAA